MVPPIVDGKNTSFNIHVYPPEFEENYMVGNLGMLDVTANTWFGNDLLYVHMINAIPITAVSNALFGKKYVKYEYPSLMNGRGNVEMAWRGYTVSIHSIIDPNKAWEDASALVSNQLDSALSKSQVLYFISQQPGFNVTLDSDTHENKGSQGTNTGSQSTAASSCESNPECAALNLGGECCPASDGAFLSCCSTSESDTQGNKGSQGTETASQSTSSSSSSCESNPDCAALNLSGECCPSDSGDFLSCCST